MPIQRQAPPCLQSGQLQVQGNSIDHFSYEFDGRELRHSLLRWRQSGGSPVGAPVIVFPDPFLATTRILWHSGAAGLMPLLAACGYDVIRADLGEQGLINRDLSPADMGLHQLITLEIPALLEGIAALSGNQPGIWVFEGSSGPLLLAALARCGHAMARPRGVVHINPLRRRPGVGMVHRLHRRLQRTFSGGPRIPRPYRTEMRRWQQMEQWLDPRDGFNYRVAARSATIPPSLYVYAAGVLGAGNRAAIELWMEELGRHDAQVIGLHTQAGRIRQSKERDSALDQGVKRKANGYDFSQFVSWIDEVAEK